MIGDDDHKASLWLQAGLLFTTRPMPQYPTGLSPPLPEGWKARAAALRWFCIWRDCPDALRRLRAIVLPEPWKDDPWGWDALCVCEMHTLGLVTEAPALWTRILSERRLFERLASPWSDLPSGDIR